MINKKQHKKITALICVFCIGLFFQNCTNSKSNDEQETKRVTIMGLGDSITEGSDYFHSYLYSLWERLYTAGYQFEFIGPRTQQCRIGKIKHCGFSGKNAEFLDSKIDSIYREYPADVVLLHSGHNHFVDENPIDGIINAQKSIINKIKNINSDVKIVVAKVILSGKLPKYSYIPELNKRIQSMVDSLNDPNITLVDQSVDWEWEKYTINDKVHQNLKGAEHMADVWFKELKNILPKTNHAYEPEIVNYKTTEQGDLKLHVFKPDEDGNHEKKPAIVFFFAGGWNTGTPLQFYRECSYYASKGMVAISADYRIAFTHHTTPYDSDLDAKDAICWIRKNADKYNIDPNKIVAAGASAGGQLAAATGTLEFSDTIQDPFCGKPNLMVLKIWLGFH